MNSELTPTAGANPPVVAQPANAPVVVAVTPIAAAAPAPAPIAPAAFSAPKPVQRLAKKQRATKRTPVL